MWERTGCLVAQCLPPLTRATASPLSFPYGPSEARREQSIRGSVESDPCHPGIEIGASRCAAPPAVVLRPCRPRRDGDSRKQRRAEGASAADAAAGGGRAAGGGGGVRCWCWGSRRAAQRVRAVPRRILRAAVSRRRGGGGGRRGFSGHGGCGRRRAGLRECDAVSDAAGGGAGETGGGNGERGGGGRQGSSKLSRRATDELVTASTADPRPRKPPTDGAPAGEGGQTARLLVMVGAPADSESASRKHLTLLIQHCCKSRSAARRCARPRSESASSAVAPSGGPTGNQRKRGAGEDRPADDSGATKLPGRHTARLRSKQLQTRRTTCQVNRGLFWRARHVRVRVRERGGQPFLAA